MKTINRATGRAFGLKYFGAKQFSFGVRAMVWGRKQLFPGAFIVRSLGGNVFKNRGGIAAKSRRSNAVEKMFGPSLSKELLEPPIVETHSANARDVSDRAMHELAQLLTVR